MLKIQGQPKVWMGDKITAKLGTATATTGVITGITIADPGVVTDVGHGLTTGDVVRLSGIVGTVELNATEQTIIVLSADTFSIEDTSAMTAYTSDGIWTLLETDEATVTLSMSGAEILVEGISGITYDDIAVGDYCVSPITVSGKTGAAVWEIVQAATFAKYLVAQGG